MRVLPRPIKIWRRHAFGQLAKWPKRRVLSQPRARPSTLQKREFAAELSRHLSAENIPGFDVHEFEKATTAIPGVISVDHTHSWSINGQSHVLTTDLVLRAGMTRQEIIACKDQVRGLLDARISST